MNNETSLTYEQRISNYLSNSSYIIGSYSALLTSVLREIKEEQISEGYLKNVLCELIEGYLREGKAISKNQWEVCWPQLTSEEREALMAGIE